MQLLSPTRRRLLAGAVLLAGILAVGARALAGDGEAPASSRAAEAVAVSAAPPPKVVVHVVGAVRVPGLYRLPDGSRVADALAEAGGPTPKADLAALNLAAPVADGVQVAVPARAPAGAAPAPATSAAVDAPVRLSTATVEQLDALPGVGPVTAQRIVEYRDAHGAFRSVDELDAVPGIGPARVDQLRELVTP